MQGPHYQCVDTYIPETRHWVGAPDRSVELWVCVFLSGSRKARSSCSTPQTRMSTLGRSRDFAKYTTCAKPTLVRGVERVDLGS